MPDWLAIILGCLGGISAATGTLCVWLRPLFKIKEQVDNNTKRIKNIEEKQDEAHKARLRNEKFQKAQIKALLALLNGKSGEQDVAVLKTVQAELQQCLIENI